jgi:hypothetical protein
LHDQSPAVLARKALAHTLDRFDLIEAIDDVLIDLNRI